MLYNVITFTGKAVIGVSLYDAKRFLRAYYEGLCLNLAVKAKLQGWMVFGSVRGGQPFIMAHIVRSKNV